MDELLIDSRANDNDIDSDYYYSEYLRRLQDEQYERQSIMEELNNE